MWEKYITLFNKYPFIAISDLITISPMLVGLISYRYLSKEFKFLFYFLVSHVILDLLSTWLSVKMLNNLHIFNITEIIEATAICLIFIGLLSKYTFKKILISLLLISCICVGIGQFDFKEFAFIPYIFNRLTYVILIFIYFNTLLSEINIKNILIHPPFWLCAGLIIYATGTLIIFLFGRQILSSNAPHEEFIFFYSIISFINILFRLILSVAFWVSRYENK